MGAVTDSLRSPGGKIPGPRPICAIREKNNDELIL